MEPPKRNVESFADFTQFPDSNVSSYVKMLRLKQNLFHQTETR